MAGCDWDKKRNKHAWLDGCELDKKRNKYAWLDGCEWDKKRVCLVIYFSLIELRFDLAKNTQ